MSQAPDTTEVLAALDSILASPSFVRARRAQSLLRFVTQETLEGRADTLNGHAIATAVFGKTPDFDPSTDPLVRVEARRLRSKLCEYYATVGAQDRVVIELRPGSYVPTFRVAAEPAHGCADASLERCTGVLAKVMLVVPEDSFQQQFKLDLEALGLAAGVRARVLRDHFGIQTRQSDTSRSISIGFEM